ncbi:MAG: DUF2867 domain-containing protein [Thermoplasmata archaeon]|nr:MAG: DUF2867 domain-containing protein [Thermoplasmata archaeon]
MTKKPILVLGSSGYVGTRLVEQLIIEGYKVRAVARNKNRLKNNFWAAHPSVEIISADILDLSQVRSACKSCETAYYLIHSMLSSKKGFAEADRKAAQNFVNTAESEGLKRIIYLGGLGEKESGMGEHLRSRAEVADILKSGKVPVTYLRAAMIIGSGGSSFEIVRYLVDRLPVMTTPNWVYTKSQPISISNVIQYLTKSLEVPETIGETFDIGGPDILSYKELFDLYSGEAKLKKRWIVKLPILTPKMSSYWVALVTPVKLTLIRPLIEGLRTEAICKDNRIKNLIPQNLITCKRAIRAAINPEQHFTVYNLKGLNENNYAYEWSRPGDPPYSGGQVFEGSFELITESTAEEIWEPLKQISTDLSCCYNDIFWKWWRRADAFAGDVAFRIGLPGTTFKSKDGVFWRVVSSEPKKRLVIIAEVEIFGWMLKEFLIESVENGGTKLKFNIKFHPRGLAGISYWFATSMLHQVVFNNIMSWVAGCLTKTCTIKYT